MRTAGENLEVWFLTGSQELYGEATLRQVAAQSKEIVALLNGGPEIGVPLVWKPVLTDADASAALAWTPTAPTSASV